MASDNETRETIADIVAEMKHTKYGDEDCSVKWCLREWADRLEAAWKREARAIATEHAVLPAVCITKPSGNAAAMREALVAVKKSIDDIGKSSIDCDPTIIMVALTQVCARLSARIEQALAAPARNCDKFVTQPEMSRAYEEYRKYAMKNYGNGLTGRVPTVKQKPMTYDEWLLAPAAERKGEGDAI